MTWGYCTEFNNCKSINIITPQNGCCLDDNELLFTEVNGRQVAHSNPVFLPLCPWAKHFTNLAFSQGACLMVVGKAVGTDRQPCFCQSGYRACLPPPVCDYEVNE